MSTPGIEAARSTAGLANPVIHNYIAAMSYHFETRDWLGWAAVAVFAIIGVYAIVSVPSHGQPAAQTAKAVVSFEKMVTVLQSPRCMNCHRSDVPRVRDDARHHVPRVEPGKDGKGLGGFRCVICHRVSNNTRSRIPGAPGWQQAPYTMSWDGLAASDICDNIKDRSMNGDRDLAALLTHLKRDHLVKWAWAPGHNRTQPPLAYDDFLAHVSAWVSAGGPCPQSTPTTGAQ